MLGVPRDASQKEVKNAYYEVSVCVCMREIETDSDGVIIWVVYSATTAGKEVPSRPQQGRF